jgi:tetratricopeptide (TPR) repeat protein
VAPPLALAERIHALCDEALFLQAHALTLPYGPLEGWTGTACLLAASRLAAHAGAPRLGRRLALRAYRHDRRDPEAIVHWAYVLLERRGAHETWTRLARVELPASAHPELRSRLTRLRATAALILRDFDAARALLDQAEREHPADAWFLVDRSCLLEREDRYDEALAVARDALARFPLNRAALQQLARLLTIHDRRGEAIALLTDAEARLESPALTLLLASLLGEERRFAEQQRALDRAAALSPLLEAEEEAQLAAMRSDCAYQRGEIDLCIAEAKKSNNPFFSRIAERLSTRPEGRRPLLDLAFVRQHHLTCVPATLSTISRFWGKEAAQLEIAEAICYDGTPAHSERRWAEQNGWVTRELTVTWESVKALIDRGVPFTLATVEVGSAHMQAVIGYDDRRGTFHLRDPYLPVVLEVVAELFFERYRASGPRGMALVPRAEAARLEGFEAPDGALHDALHRLDSALDAHDRPAAMEALAELSREAPGHVITLRGERALGAYDADLARVQRSAEALLARFPGDGNAELAVLACMTETASQKERVARLEALFAKGPMHPALVLRLTGELGGDARAEERSARLLRRLLRLGLERAEPFGQLANLAWNARRFDEAISLLRFGASVEPLNEGAAQAYFNAARLRDRSEAALSSLQQRYARLGARSAGPVATLCAALQDLDRTVEAFAVLDEALARRPDDGELALFAAQERARYGFEAEARALLARAEGRVRRASFLRIAAALADRLDTPAAALPLWRELLDREPFAEDANAQVAAHLGMTEGEEAACAHLDAVCARFPHHRGLLRLCVDRLGDRDPAAAERAVRRFLEIEPESAWGHRALASLLLSQGRPLDEVAAAVEAAAAIEPSSAAQLLMKARLAQARGDLGEAKEAYREVIRRAPDAEEAIFNLINASEKSDERLADLALIEAEVVAHAGGDGLASWFGLARAHLPSEALLASLAALRAARPNLEAGWTFSAHYLTNLGRLDEALALAEESCARFPLLPRTWHTLAMIRRLRREPTEEIAALERALSQNATFSDAVLRLADARVAQGDEAAARALLDRTLARAPLDGALLRKRAELGWKAGEREEALAALRKALLVNADDSDAWRLLHELGVEIGRPDEALRFARERAAARPWDAAIRLTLARILAAGSAFDEALTAIDAALARAPRLLDAHDLRAQILSDLGRHEEARAACAPAAFGDAVPVELRGRAAFLLAEMGDPAGAAEALRALVAERPDYTWAWLKLAGLAQAAGAHDEQLAAAGQVIKLAPVNPVGHGYAGDAYRKLDRPDEARRALERALTLSPSYTFAGFALIDLALAAKKARRARKAIEALAPHVAPSTLASRKIELALLEDDRPAANQIFTALCRDPATPTTDLHDAHEALAARALAQTSALLLGLLDEPDLHAEVGAMWIRTLAAMHQRPPAGRVRALYRRGDELGERAAGAAFSALGEQRALLSTLWLMLRLFFRGKAPTVQPWALVGYALASCEAMIFTALWLRGFRKREGVEPWMLKNLSVALRARWLDGRALAVNRHTLTLPADDATQHHRLWLAFHEATEGRADDARALLQGVTEPALSRIDQMVLCFTQSMLQVQAAPREERAQAAREARRAMNEAFPARPALLLASTRARAYRTAARRIALDAQTPAALLWAYGQALAAAALVILIVRIDLPVGAALLLLWIFHWQLLRALAWIAPPRRGRAEP